MSLVNKKYFLQVYFGSAQVIQSSVDAAPHSWVAFITHGVKTSVNSLQVLASRESFLSLPFSF